MKVTKCPVCNSMRFKEIGKYNDSIVLKGKNCEFLQEPFGINECLDCGLNYKNNILTSEQFALYYNNSEFERWSHDKLYPSEKIIEQQLLSKKEKLNVLDFGCSEGRLLGQLLNNHSCYGFDINPQSLDIARSKGINIFSSFEELKNTNIRFDAILLIDVFEHLLNPMETIDALLMLLKESGEIIISTGYANSWAYRKQPAEFWYSVFPEHVCMLSDRFIEFLCERKGLKVNYKNITSHYNTPIKQKIASYIIHYSYWSTVKLRRFKSLYKIYPFKAIFNKWKSYPFFPVTKDHVVVTLTHK